MYDIIIEVKKFNPYHGSDGRFTSANAAASFTYAPGKSKAHDLAIAREKARMEAARSALQKPDKPVHIEATLRRAHNTVYGSSYRTQTVLQAKETSQGKLELSYAEPSKTNYRNNGNIDYEYELEHGLYQRSNGSGISDSIGINWDNVTQVSGKTFDAKGFLKDKGFHWDSENKVYTKEKSEAPKSTARSGNSSSGNLTIPKGGSLPSDLTGVNSISGDTYANRAQIKAAGFKWNPNTKAWVRPGVSKSAVLLLDDEPDPNRYDLIVDGGV